MNHEEVSDIVELQAKIFAKAPDIDKVLVLCTFKDVPSVSMDNGMTVAEANLLVDQFKKWMLDRLAKENLSKDK